MNTNPAPPAAWPPLFGAILWGNDLQLFGTKADRDHAIDEARKRPCVQAYPPEAVGPFATPDALRRYVQAHANAPRASEDAPGLRYVTKPNPPAVERLNVSHYFAADLTPTRAVEMFEIVAAAATEDTQP